MTEAERKIRVAWRQLLTMPEWEELGPEDWTEVHRDLFADLRGRMFGRMLKRAATRGADVFRRWQRGRQ